MNEWQREIIDYYSNISNRDLLEEVLAQARGDDWGGAFTSRGWWQFQYARSLLHERLANWLAIESDATDDLYIMRDGIYDEAPEM